MARVCGTEPGFDHPRRFGDACGRDPQHSSRGGEEFGAGVVVSVGTISSAVEDTGIDNDYKSLAVLSA